MRPGESGLNWASCPVIPMFTSRYGGCRQDSVLDSICEGRRLPPVLHSERAMIPKPSWSPCCCLIRFKIDLFFGIPPKFYAF
jgi:hypothetical protein